MPRKTREDGPSRSAISFGRLSCKRRSEARHDVDRSAASYLSGREVSAGLLSAGYYTVVTQLGNITSL